MKNWIVTTDRLSLALFSDMKQMRQAVIAVAVATVMGAGGVNGQTAFPVNLALEQ